jgi:hypothetical protein
LASAAQAAADTVFRHDDHTRLACARCHSEGAVHGRTLVRTREDCRACHHAAPDAEPCAGCHRDEAASTRLLAIVRTLSLPAGATPTRALPFRHDVHAEVACTTCHGAPPAVRAGPVDCGSCHTDHHRETAQCSSCHTPAPAAAVHPLTVHAGCTGSGCHEDPPVAELPRSRSACLVCHQSQVEHRAGGVCEDCHVLPPLGLSGPLGLARPGTR